MPADPHRAQPADAGDRRRATWTAELVLGLLAFVVVFLLTRDLFVMTEARGYAMYPQPGGLLRFFLLPELDWGSGRLLGQLQFQATWAICGVDAGCVNAVGALEAAVAVIVLVLHTRQLTGSLVLASVAGAFWVTSPALLGVSLWQATRFDVLAFIVLIAAGGFWWQALGRERLSRSAMAGTVLATVLLLVLAFNAKETTYVLMLLLPVIAVLRGLGRLGLVRRNLLLIALPLAYGAFFIAWGLTHMDASYAARSGGLSAVDGVTSLVREGLGIDRWFMYRRQEGTLFEGLRSAAIVGYAVTIASIGILAVVAFAGRGRRQAAAAVPPDAVPPDAAALADAAATPALPGRRGPLGAIAGLLVRYHAEAYLAAVAVLTMAVLARSSTPSAYYTLIPTWAVIVLVLIVVRRLAALTPWPRVASAIVVGAWAVTHLLVLSSLVSPGSAYDQLLGASARMKDLGGMLRALLAGQPPGPVAWRTIGVPDTDFYLLRDPARDRPEGQEGYAVGQELLPYLLGARDWRPRVETLLEGTVDEIRAVPPLTGEREMVVVIDDQYRLLLFLYEGRPLFDRAPGSGPG